MPSRSRLLAGDRPQLGRVDLGHVGEPRAEPVVVRPAERVRADQVEVVGQADEVARAQVGR